MSHICIIPSKGKSTRLARKNLLKLGDHSLLAYSIQKAKKCNIFSHICVSTEDEDIATEAKKYGAEVPFIRRAHLSEDPATIMDVINHALSSYEEDKELTTITVLLPTTPFVVIDDIVNAHEVFYSNNSEALLGVTKCEFPPFNSWVIDDKNILMPCFPESPYKFTQSTSCPDTYRSNGAILILDISKLKELGHYKDLKITPYVMDSDRSLDIDTEFEYKFAKFIFDSNAKQMEKELF